MHIESIHIGQAVTVLTGTRITCPLGCCTVGEVYEHLKGLPLIVLGIDIPYVVAAMPTGNMNVVLDTRECRLKELSEDYLACFKRPTSPPATPTVPQDQVIEDLTGEGK